MQENGGGWRMMENYWSEWKRMDKNSFGWIRMEEDEKEWWWMEKGGERWKGRRMVLYFGGWRKWRRGEEDGLGRVEHGGEWIMKQDGRGWWERYKDRG